MFHANTKSVICVGSTAVSGSKSTKYPSQLFDLENDPNEIQDLGQDPKYSHVIEECHQKLLTICDPDETDRRAKSRQAENLAANGGREAVIARGDIGFTPAPGAAADFL